MKPNDKAVEALTEHSREILGFVLQDHEAQGIVEAAAPHIERAFVDRLTEVDWLRLRHLLNASTETRLGDHDSMKEAGRRLLKRLIPK